MGRIKERENLITPRLNGMREVGGPGKDLRPRQCFVEGRFKVNQIKAYDEAREEWNEFIDYGDPTADQIIDMARRLTRQLFKHDVDSAACARIRRQPIISLALKQLKSRFGKDSECVAEAIKVFTPLKTWRKTELDADEPEHYRAEKVFRSDIPDDLVEDPAVTDIAVRVYLVMSKVCPNSRHDVSTPIAPATIAERIKRRNGQSISVKTVRRAKENLAKAGWIEVKHAKGRPDETILFEIKQGVQDLDKKRGV